MKSLLSKGSTNYKLAKNANFGYDESYILYLSPYKNNSKQINICPKASAACIFGCLNSAGRGSFSNVQKARREKTEFLLSNRKAFIDQLWKELKAIDKKAGKSFIRIPVRLNGTSDLDWPKLFNSYGYQLADLENVVFYDYTKVYSRLTKYVNNPLMSLNYHITFSRSEVNETEAIEALKNGYNVAVVFKGKLPETWKGYKVINGDESDLRFLDPANVVVGLTAKGKAKKDTTGFVVSQ